MIKITTAILLALALAMAGFGQAGVKKVTRAEAMSAATSKVQPEYPVSAKQLKVQGTVELEATVTESGAVESVSIVNGNPILTRAASDAVKKWKFTPFTADGKATKAVAPIQFSFVL